MDINQLQKDLVRDEGLRLKPYKDTVGKITIGVGRNLDDVGISEIEAMTMLSRDILNTKEDLNQSLPWWALLPEAQQRALANMCFNLGIGGLLAFKGMLAALQMGDYERAAQHAMDSLWAKQVGSRAMRICQLIRSR